MENEALLIDALRSLVGRNKLYVFSDASMDRNGLVRQVEIFHNTHVIIGWYYSRVSVCLNLNPV